MSQGFEPKHVFSMDETGLQYRAQPIRSQEKGDAAGGESGKKCRDSITVGLAVNSDGTERLPPIVIGKDVESACFPEAFDPNWTVDYYIDPKAWMNAEVEKYFLQPTAPLLLNGSIIAVEAGLFLLRCYRLRKNHKNCPTVE